MPKKIKSFTIHLCNSETKTEEIEKYLEDNFGPSWDKTHEHNYWYLGRNYDRPYNESHIEITFYSEPNHRHTIMSFIHPYNIINIDADEWYEVSNEHFCNLFEEGV